MYVEIRTYLGKDLIGPVGNPYNRLKITKTDANYYSKLKLGQMLSCPI